MALAGTADDDATTAEEDMSGEHSLAAGLLAAVVSLCLVFVAGSVLAKAKRSRQDAATVKPMLMPLRRGDIFNATTATGKPRPRGNGRVLFRSFKVAPPHAATSAEPAVATTTGGGTRAGLAVYSIAASTVAWKRALETGRMAGCEIMRTAETGRWGEGETAAPEPMPILPRMLPGAFATTAATSTTSTTVAVERVPMTVIEPNQAGHDHKIRFAWAPAPAPRLPVHVRAGFGGTDL